MRTVVLATAITLAMSASALAQGTASPPPSDPQAAPAASPDDQQQGRRGRRGRQGAEPVQPLESCDKGSPGDIRKCKAGNIRALQQALNRKVMDECNKRTQSAGVRGRGRSDEQMACRYDMMNKLLQSIN